MRTLQVRKDSEIPDDFTGLVITPSGTKKYFKDGLLHREDGPAIEWSTGAESWYYEGVRHRADGPAFKLSEDGKRNWWLNGEETSAHEVFEQMTDDQKEKAAWEINKWK